jgi:hypothetical protein
MEKGKKEKEKNRLVELLAAAVGFALPDRPA